MLNGDATLLLVQSKQSKLTSMTTPTPREIIRCEGFTMNCSELLIITQGKE